MTIPVAEPLVPWDVAVDDGGNIYVLDDTQGMLDQYDHQGRLKRRISVVVTHPRGPMHIVSGMLYLSGSHRNNTTSACASRILVIIAIG